MLAELADFHRIRQDLVEPATRGRLLLWKLLILLLVMVVMILLLLKVVVHHVQVLMSLKLSLLM